MTAEAEEAARPRPLPRRRAPPPPGGHDLPPVGHLAAAVATIVLPFLGGGGDPHINHRPVVVPPPLSSFCHLKLRVVTLDLGFLTTGFLRFQVLRKSETLPT